MAVDEYSIRIRRSIEEKLGVEETAYLVSGRPPGGWDSLVTKEHLDVRLDGLEARTTLRLEALEERMEGLEERTALRLKAFEERMEGLEERTALRLEAFEHRVHAKLSDLSGSVDRRLRAQTWIMTGTLVTGLGVALGLGQAL